VNSGENLAGILADAGEDPGGLMGEAWLRCGERCEERLPLPIGGGVWPKKEIFT